MLVERQSNHTKLDNLTIERQAVNLINQFGEILLTPTTTNQQQQTLNHMENNNKTINKKIIWVDGNNLSIETLAECGNENCEIRVK